MIDVAPRIASMTLNQAEAAKGGSFPAARSGRTVSLLLDLGRGSHVLVREVVAVQCLSAGGDWQSRFRQSDQPLATVILRGGAVLPGFRSVDELREEWERSLIVFDPADLLVR